jgi:tripartite-type tricarboxylate transporter receptor subunit TctC
MKAWIIAAVGGALLSVAVASSAVRADAVADFYGKTDVRLIIGVAVGGSYDASGRLVSRHIGKHIPGNPRILIQNMPGASSRLAANHIYSVAPKDGSIIGAVSESIPLAQAMGEQGIRFDANKFNWIGTPVQPVSVLGVWYTTGIKTLQDTKTKELVVGATSVSGTNYVYPALIKELLGAKFRIVVGYDGGNAINLAMERGEVGARGSMVWTLIKREQPDWIREGKLIPIVQMTLEKAPDLQNVPRLIDVADTPDAKAVFEVLASTDGLGRPLLTTPDVPADRLAALRKAFDTMVKDPAFLADAAKAGEDISPNSGETLQRIVANVLGAPPAAFELFKTALAKRSGTVDCSAYTDQKYCVKEKP